MIQLNVKRKTWYIMQLNILKNIFWSMKIEKITSVFDIFTRPPRKPTWKFILMKKSKCLQNTLKNNLTQKIFQKTIYLFSKMSGMSLKFWVKRKKMYELLQLTWKEIFYFKILIIYHLSIAYFNCILWKRFQSHVDY